MAELFKKIAIANRGEVAVRIINACHEMGIRTLLLHSEADIHSKAYRSSDETECVGPAPANESYLNIASNINAALKHRVDAIHPGFGFLSENADFVKACEDANINFIGPPSHVIRMLGDKVRSKALADGERIPTLPGYTDSAQEVNALINACADIGFPVIAKAAAGGGGRGMKIITSPDNAKTQLESAKREAFSSFGSDTIFLEKYLDHAKHIEFQIFGDAAGNTVHLLDRECTIQRRHQKIIEEAISPSLSPDLRKTIGNAAVRIARRAGYLNAGTVEFLVQDDTFYFLEVNPRLQVEHPVTEMTLGIDLVKAQIFTAAGLPLPQPVAATTAPRGHAIECRIYAEDPYNGGIPSTGTITAVQWPDGPGRRFDYGFEPGDEITSHYDSMLAKIIVWDDNRSLAMKKLQYVLDHTVIFGIKTNIPYLKAITAHPDFQNGSMTTQFIDRYFGEGLARPILTPDTIALSEMVSRKLSDTTCSRPHTQTILPSPWHHTWETN